MRQTALLLVFATVALGGCSSKRAMYTVGFLNKTGAKLTEVRAYAQRFEAVCGNLGTQQPKAHAGIPGSPPDEVTVEWTTPDGKPHSKVVRFRQHFPAEIDGAKVYLIIGKDETITVRAFTKQEREAGKTGEFEKREREP